MCTQRSMYGVIHIGLCEKALHCSQPQKLTSCSRYGSSIFADAVTSQALPHMTTYRTIFEWTPRLEDTRSAAHQFQIEGPANLNCSVTEFRVMVQKCKYCIMERDSLHTLAADLGTHWTQIWSSNPSLVAPDYIASGTLISLGNMFRTRFGDTWKALSVRFGTPLGMIQKLNPDINFSKMSGSEIPEGLLVCIMPETCPIRRTPFPGITW
jgi:hypothetical protein